MYHLEAWMLELHSVVEAYRTSSCIIHELIINNQVLTVIWNLPVIEASDFNPSGADCPHDVSQSQGPAQRPSRRYSPSNCIIYLPKVLEELDPFHEAKTALYGMKIGFGENLSDVPARYDMWVDIVL